MQGGMESDMVLLEEDAHRKDQEVFGSETTSAGAMAVLLEKKRKEDEEFTKTGGASVSTSVKQTSLLASTLGKRRKSSSAGLASQNKKADLELLPKSFYVQGREAAIEPATTGKAPGSPLGGMRASRGSTSYGPNETLDGVFKVAVIIRPTLALAQRLASRGLAGPVET